MDNAVYANALRAIAEWYETHPEIPAPHDAVLQNGRLDSADDAQQVVRALTPCRKEFSDTLFKVSRDFGGVTLEFLFWRNSVCRRRVVGTEQVPEHTTPAYTREIVEWDCDPVLAPDAPDAA